MTSDVLDFRSIDFQSPERPDRRWLEWFLEEFSRHVGKVETVLPADVPLRLMGQTRMLPDLTLYRGHCSAARNHNLPQSATNDDVALVIGLGGDMSMQVAGKDDPVSLSEGTAVLISSDQANVFETHTASDFLMVRLQRRQLEPLVPNLSDLSGWSSGETQASRLLLGYLRMLAAEPSISSVEARHLATTHVHDLAALMLGSSRDAEAAIATRGKRAARLAAIEADILANLASPDLAAASLAASHGVTPRYVHMLFETKGTTFGEFVLMHRLGRAHRMLQDPRLAGRPIATIALDVGFGDLSYFNRTFRRRFGATPSDVRAGAATP